MNSTNEMNSTKAEYRERQVECYQCEKIVHYLFPDGRCKDCTRITPDELTGGD